MKVISSVQEMQSLSLRLRGEGRRIGFVPTMGYLHEGHLSLVRRARMESDVVVVSIFVNPTQFGPGEDFESYPRDMRRDCGMCEKELVDFVFAPDADGMYPPGSSVYVDEGELSRGLCGATRPGHFRGVLTVVAKLFNIVQPGVTVFGQKDAQQARVIEQMAKDLNFPVKLLIAPIVREEDGLAMSSRNARLSPSERRDAVCLYKALCLAKEMHAAGESETRVITAAMTELLGRVPAATVQYVEVVDYATLKPVSEIKSTTLIALAVKLGATRLIDNIVISPSFA